MTLLTTHNECFSETVESQALRGGLQKLSPNSLVFSLWAVQAIADVSLSLAGVGARGELRTILFSRIAELALALLLAWANGLLLLRPSVRIVLPMCLLIASTSGTMWWLDSSLQAVNNGVPFTKHYLSSLRFNIGYFTATFTLQTVAVALLESMRKIAARESQLAITRDSAQQALIAALRFQLDPHFLFNTMNAISALVAEGENREAEEIIARLCGFLRLTLTTNPGAFHSLDTELEVISHYLDIEGYRFGERLIVQYQCPAEMRDAMVPALILQPLVENAIKYAVKPSLQPVTITIRAEQRSGLLRLFVEDDGLATASVESTGTQVGLSNIRARLRSLYGEQGALHTLKTATGFCATLQLPYHQATQPEGL